MLFDVFIAVLATWQIIEIWHHSLLFAGARARVELWENKLGELLVCPFCLSPWVAALSVIVLLVPAWLQLSGWYILTTHIIWYAFAVSRLANICNDITRKISRTPKPFDGILDSFDTDVKE